MFEPLYTAEEMRAAEEGHDVDAMMERAGRAIADEVRRLYPDARRIAAVCGKGSNGGDGRIAVRLLREAGLDAEETDDPTGADVVPDAAALIERINAVGAPVVAVDIPSGVDASTGEVAGAAVRAVHTVTMHARKVGLVVAPGRFHAGTVTVADIGIAQRETEHKLVT